MTFGLNYNLYNPSYHTKKSNLYSYKANNYLNNCANNIKEIVLAPRFIGLATCTLLLVVASFLPFLHSPILGYFTTNTIALISGDPAFVFTGVIFSSGQYYSLLDKAKIFGTTIMLMDNSHWGMKIAKCFVENVKNVCAYTSYQFLSWEEYFKSLLSDFFKIDKENDEILDVIPEEKIFIPHNAAEKILMHQQHVDFHHAQLVDAISSSSKNIALEGGKLVGITALMSSILVAANAIKPFVISKILVRNYQSRILDEAVTYNGSGVPTRSHEIINKAIGFRLVDTIGYPFKIIGLLASISPFFSSNYVQKYCNGDVFSIKSINYHLLRYANKEIYDEFINQLGTGVILSLSHSALMAYHTAVLYKAKWNQAYEKSAKSNLDDSTTQENLVDVSEVAFGDADAYCSDEYDNESCVTCGEATEAIID
jgi:hypothetical protein